MIVDAHNDLALELVLRREEPNPFARHWLPHLRAGGAVLQVCPLYAADQPPDRARETALDQATELHRALRVQGRELVDLLGKRGAVLDLAHASEPTFVEAVERARRVVVSHAGCRALRDHPRNLADDQLSALAAREGILGLMALALVVGEPPTIERLADHVDHAVEAMGIEHVGLGADFIDQVDALEVALGKEQTEAMNEARRVGGGRLGLRDLQGPEDYPRLVEALERRGYEGDRLARILSSNLLRLVREALPHGPSEAP